MSDTKLTAPATSPASDGSARDLDECCNCGKPQTYPGEHAECEDCGEAVCDSCIVAGVNMPGWHNGDFHCPPCASKREAPNADISHSARQKEKEHE